MGRYLMTHSLLASWLYTMKENPYEDMTTERDPMGEFMPPQKRSPGAAPVASSSTKPRRLWRSAV